MPPFKLSKVDHEKITAAANRIEEPAEAVIAAVTAYNEALGALRALVRAIETDWQAAWDKRSERWQEGAAGNPSPRSLRHGMPWRTSLTISRLSFRKSKYPSTD